MAADWIKALQGDLADIFESDYPRALYGSYVQGLGPSQNLQGYYMNRFSDVMDRYAAEVFRRSDQGQEASTLRFGTGEESFLEDFPFLQEYYARPPGMRGETQRQLAPPVRFLF